MTFLEQARKKFSSVKSNIELKLSSNRIKFLTDQVEQQKIAIETLQLNLNKIANDSYSYLNFNGERIDRLRCDLWEANHASLNRIYNLRAAVQKERKINAIFMVPDTTLWDVYKPIYDRLSKNARFTVSVIAFNRVDIASDKTVEEIVKFFSAMQVNVHAVGFDEKPLPTLESYDPDIVFYTLGSTAYPESFRIENVSLSTRTCYLSYGFLLANEFEYQFNQQFHHSAWLVVASTKRELELYERYRRRRSTNVVLASYTKFELLDRRLHEVARTKRPLVIWAPHWTIGNIYPSLNLGTFDIFAQDMFDLIKRNDQIDFVFKPHPNLEYAVNNVGGLNYGEYVEQLQTLPNCAVSKHGDYAKLFLESSAMLTDSVSFLAEYLPSSNPLFFFNRKDRVKLSDVGEEIVQNHYSGYDIKAVELFLIEIVLKSVDPMKASRLQYARNALELDSELGSVTIIRFLEKCFSVSH